MSGQKRQISRKRLMKVPIESNNILIVGFGKIGKIKANKWLDRGYSVYVKDVNFFDLMLLNKGTSKNTSRASRASNLSLIYSLFLVNFCL